jgi:hypothetical protein
MNFGELVAQIADDLIDERLSNAQIQNAINQAIRFYSRKTFYFTTIKDVITAVPGQAYYDETNSSLLVADLYTLQTVRYSNAEISVALYPAEDASIENVSISSPDYPFPRYYAYAQMQLRLYPLPKEAGTITIIATRMLPKLVEDTDSNVFLERADELIRQAAKRYISFNNLHDQALGDRCAALEAEEYASLLAENRNREPAVPMQSPIDLINLPGGNTYYDITLDR